MRRPRIGTISPPGWRSFCGDEMVMAARCDIEVIDVAMPLGDDFAFKQGQILAAASAIEEAATQLAEQNVSAILQIGGPFAFLHGQEEAMALEARITSQTNVPFQMMAVSMLRSLEKRMAQRVMVCSAYYPEEWRAPLVRFIEASDVSALGCLSFDEIHASKPQDHTMMADSFENIHPDTVISALTECAKERSADAIYLAGVSCPLLVHQTRLQDAAHVPLISYLDSYTRLFESVGIRQV